MRSCETCGYLITERVYEKYEGNCIDCSHGEFRDFFSPLPFQHIGYWKSEYEVDYPDPTEIGGFAWSPQQRGN